MHGLVLFAVFELEDLVGCERCGCEANDEVNVFAQVDILDEIRKYPRFLLLHI